VHDYFFSALARIGVSTSGTDALVLMVIVQYVASLFLLSLMPEAASKALRAVNHAGQLSGKNAIRLFLKLLWR